LPPQADEISKLQEESSQLARIVEQGRAAQAELQHLQQQAGELSGVGQELQQTRAALLELQAVARQLEQHRLQISSLADQKAELEAALQQQAELTAEVSVMERDYNDMLTKARRACELQEQLPRLQVRSYAACSFAEPPYRCEQDQFVHGIDDRLDPSCPLPAPPLCHVLLSAFAGFLGACLTALFMLTGLLCTCYCNDCRRLPMGWRSWNWSIASCSSCQTRQRAFVLKTPRWLRRWPHCQTSRRQLQTCSSRWCRCSMCGSKYSACR